MFITNWSLWHYYSQTSGDKIVFFFVFSTGVVKGGKARKESTEIKAHIFSWGSRTPSWTQRKRAAFPHSLPDVTGVSSICQLSHQPDECSSRPFLRWVWVQGCNPDAPSSSKNVSGLVSIPQKRRVRCQAINLIPPRRVKVWGDGPVRHEVWS